MVFKEVSLFGIKAISAQNGWQYAFLGICIVFSGLIILSFVLSQLHKLLSLWENRASIGQRLKERFKRDTSVEEPESTSIELSPDLMESKQHYQMLVDRIGDPFSLPKLLRLAEKSGLLRPYANLNELLQAGIILPDKDGYYTWKQ